MRTRGDATLGVVWGDMPLEQYLRERLARHARRRTAASAAWRASCRATTARTRPCRTASSYCPQASMARLRRASGLPDRALGHAGRDSRSRSRRRAPRSSTTCASTAGRSTRAARTRAAPARLAGNLRASFADSGQDVLDMGRHLVTGTTRENIHTGQLEKRTSLLAAVPMLVVGVARLEPLQGGKDFIEGIQSGVQVAADAVSATNNAVINPLLQVTVGVASPEAADDAGHFTGAVTQAWAQESPRLRAQHGRAEPALALVSQPRVQADGLHPHRHPAQHRSDRLDRQHLRRLRPHDARRRVGGGRWWRWRWRGAARAADPCARRRRPFRRRPLRSSSPAC